MGILFLTFKVGRRLEKQNTVTPLLSNLRKDYQIWILEYLLRRNPITKHLSLPNPPLHHPGKLVSEELYAGEAFKLRDTRSSATFATFTKCRWQQKLPTQL